MSILAIVVIITIIVLIKNGSYDIDQCKTISNDVDVVSVINLVNDCESVISTYINTKMCVCVFVCLSVYSRFSRPFGIRLGYPLVQSCLMLPKWF